MNNWRALLQLPEVTFLAAMHETLGHGLQFLPTGTDLLRFIGRDVIVGGGAGNHGQQVGELLDDFVRRWNQEVRVRVVSSWVADEEPAALLANPLDEALIVGAPEQGFDAVERIGRATAGGVVRRFGPLVNHGERKVEIGGDLLGAGFLKDLSQQLVGMHEAKMQTPLPL